jgi:hypothetical protein
MGNGAMQSTTTGSFNTAFGEACLSNNTTGQLNVAFGLNQQSGNFEQVTMIGIADTATGNNQMRFGSSAYVNGAVNTEVVVSDKTWSVFINGVAYKILLKA